MMARGQYSTRRAKASERSEGLDQGEGAGESRMTTHGVVLHALWSGLSGRRADEGPTRELRGEDLRVSVFMLSAQSWAPFGLHFRRRIRPCICIGIRAQTPARLHDAHRFVDG